MKILITGVAGFIGSCLAEALLARGDEVIGVDCFKEPGIRWVKEHNLKNFRALSSFRLIQEDLLQMDLVTLLQGVDAVAHHGGMAGVYGSWGGAFENYLNNNVLTTQRLLEACRVNKVKKFVYASSSSVYGEAVVTPTHEDVLPAPLSPYGVSKLAGEHLCSLYSKCFAVPTISLRYFTVYGPRQRPDMAFHKFIKAILAGQPLSVYGDGLQVRDFTFIDDVIRANLAALDSQRSGLVVNIGGGSRTNINQVIAIIAEITKCSPKVHYLDKEKGDPFCTWADIGAADRHLRWRPSVEFTDGLKKEVTYIRSLYGF